MRENDLVGRHGRVPEGAGAFDPKHAMAHNNMGVVYDGLGQHEKATEAFKKAISADTKYAEAHFNLGLAYFRLGDNVRATKSFEKALILEPRRSSGPYTQLGHLYLAQGKKDRAVEAFKKAIEASADDGKKTTEAYQGLARAYLGLGKVDEAVATLKTVVEDFPKDASARSAYGDALKAKGDLDGAIAQYEEGVQLSPTPEARLALADAYAKRHVARQGAAALRGAAEGRAQPQGGEAGAGGPVPRHGPATWRWRSCSSRRRARRRSLRPSRGWASCTRACSGRTRRWSCSSRWRSGILRSSTPGRSWDRSTCAAATPTNRCGCWETCWRSSLGTRWRCCTRGRPCTGMGKTKQSEQSFRAAAQVDPNFAEPHNALGQLLEAAGRRGRGEGGVRQGRGAAVEPRRRRRPPSSGWAEWPRPRHLDTSGGSCAFVLG